MSYKHTVHDLFIFYFKKNYHWYFLKNSSSSCGSKYSLGAKNIDQIKATLAMTIPGQDKTREIKLQLQINMSSYRNGSWPQAFTSKQQQEQEKSGIWSLLTRMQW